MIGEEEDEQVEPCRRPGKFYVQENLKAALPSERRQGEEGQSGGGQKGKHRFCM